MHIHKNLNSENKNQKSNPKDTYIVEDNILNTDYLKKKTTTGRLHTRSW